MKKNNINQLKTVLAVFFCYADDIKLTYLRNIWGGQNKWKRNQMIIRE